MDVRKKLIDRENLIENFRATKVIEVFPDWKDLPPNVTSAVIRFAKKCREIVLGAPAVDAVEVVHGEWSIIEDDYLGLTALECSKCKQEFWFEDEPPLKIYSYCPNCGAKMDGDGNG